MVSNKERMGSMRIFGFLLIILVGCSKAEPQKFIEPFDEVMETKVYKDIKEIRRVDDGIMAYVIEPDKRVKTLHSWYYNIYLDSTAEPWWEETRVLHHFATGGKQSRYIATIHVRSLEDVK